MSPIMRADGDEGLALAREQVHDVIMIDRMLPQLDGLAAHPA